MFPNVAPFALFDDNLGRRGDLLLTELRDCIVWTAGDDLSAAFAAIEAARARGHWVALAAHYELAYALEPRLHARLPHDGTPLLTAWIFGRAQHPGAAAVRAGLDGALAKLVEHERLAGVAGLARNLPEAAHARAVERIRALIDAGDCYQVNFTFALTGEAYGDPLALYHVLREAQPVRYGAFIRHAQGAILSRSPELFVARHGTTLTCRPMKGTAARDTDPALLAASAKDRAENVMIVDLIRNDLGRLAPSGGVRVERLCDIEPYPSVWQMTSTVVAEPVAADLARLFAALFPCGSVTGAPKIRAMEIIDELEHEARGLYCGALGWIAPSGDFRFSVPIRTIVMDAERRIRLGLGSGIVADSQPPAEWAECLLKDRFLTQLRAPFGLIETLRCEPAAAEPYPLLDRHLARLTASAAYFGFPLDAPAVRAALLAQAAAVDGLHRVRLELDATGRVQLSATALAPAAGAPCPTVVFSPQRVASGNRLARHKTTARGLYERELTRVTQAGHFDALFCNEHDELAEGARSNVFLDMGDGVLHTPPLASGALDGVFRRKLLDEGRARETRLTRGDVHDAKAAYVANALRGLLRVALAA
jgi:para-aminobenzoate synthetase/4-amino-4-deoxychorismate lyase